MRAPKTIQHSTLILAMTLLGSGCGGGNPLRGQSEQCEPTLGADACIAPLMCETAGGSGTATCVMPKSQQEAEPCDEDYGIDACGAGLFCAAFDGRDVSTCYRLYSRRPGQACATNESCTNGRCANLTCEPNAEYEPCLADSECAAGLFCGGSISGRYCQEN